jgi:hypothetical protein
LRIAGHRISLGSFAAYIGADYTALRREPEMNSTEGMPPIMTNRLENQPSRRLACAACGAEFNCGLSGPCWCSDEAFRLPMPTDGSDCLCPACLRKLAEQRAGEAAT